MISFTLLLSLLLASCRARPDPTSPIITISIRNISVSHGQRAQMFCEAAGFPKPKVRISKKVPKFAKVVDVDFNDIDVPLEIGSAYKVFSGVTSNDVGWYYCKAKNSLGTQIARGYLSLSDPCSNYRCPGDKVCELDAYTERPVCRCPTRHCVTFDAVCGSDCQTYFSECFLETQRCETGSNITVVHRGFCSIPSPPRVNYWQSNITVGLGQPIELRCNAEGIPAPQVSWFHQLDEEEPVSVSDNDLLYIEEAQLLDSGLYFCQAQTCGDLIAESNMFEIHVESPPVLPTCVVAGNGHVRTFDSQAYSFGGTCSYMLARDCSHNDWFIYSRFGDCRVQATCLEAFTVYHDRTYFEVGRGWFVNMGFDNFVMAEDEERLYPEQELTLRMNGTHIHVILPKLRIIWDGVTTAHVVLREAYKQTQTCGLCGGNYGHNTYRSRMLSQTEALELVVESRLDYYHQCEHSYLQTYQCTGAARHQATATCKAIFDCSGFSLCKQVVDIAWYMSTCIQDTCNKEYLSAYPAPCRATAAFKEMCSIAGFDVSQCIHHECNVKNVLVGSQCPNTLPFRGCGPTL